MRICEEQKLGKSSLGRKNEGCPDPNETINENTNHEFRDKIVAI